MFIIQQCCIRLCINEPVHLPLLSTEELLGTTFHRETAEDQTIRAKVIR